MEAKRQFINRCRSISFTEHVQRANFLLRWNGERTGTTMARGWESKSITDQMEQANERSLQGQPHAKITPVERAQQEKLEALRLSRSRTLAQLENATRPPHREMLQRTLRALEAEIEELG